MGADMRLILLLVFLFFSLPAIARMDPGHPPWHCRPFEACDESVCVRVLAPLVGFELRKSEVQENGFVIVGFNGDERSATVFPSLEAAHQFVEIDRSKNRATSILIPNKQVSDSHGFDLYAVGTRGTGQRFVAKESLRISCGRKLQK